MTGPENNFAAVAGITVDAVRPDSFSVISKEQSKSYCLKPGKKTNDI